MEFVSQSLMGKVIPVIFDYGRNKIAQPNTSLAVPGKEVVWECADWLNFHKGLVRFFMEGRFTSKVKNTKPDAIQNANQVFMQHWERNANFWSSLRTCGYAGEFFNYFKSVGLTDVLSILQAIVVPTANTAANLVDTTTKTVDRTAAAAGQTIVNASDTLANTTGVAKYAIPVVVGGIIILAGTYFYKNYVQGNKRVRVGITKI